MLATLIIVFREVLEAGLIVGIVLAATRGVPKRNFWVAGGIAAGVLGACVLAIFADTVSNMLEGMGQEMFNVAVLSLAVIMLIWHVVWMARHGRQMAMEMKQVGAEVSKGSKSLMALAVVVGVALLREGSEVVLFLYGIAVSGNDSVSSMLLGGIIGLALGVAVAALMYIGLLKIPVKHLFSTTGWMISLLAAGMASQAVFFLQQAGVVEVLGNTVWDSSHILSNNSLLGKILHTLIGYTDQPTGLQLAAYVGTLVLIYLLMRKFGGTSPKKLELVVPAA